MKMQGGYKILVSSGILLCLYRYFFVWGITFNKLFIANNHSFFTVQINLPSLRSYNSSIYIDSINKLFLTLTTISNNNDQIVFKKL